MRKVAIPIAGEQLSEYFGQCNYYRVFEIENGVILTNMKETPPDQQIEMLPEWASSQNITDVITYKIDKRIISLFSRKKINLFVGVRVGTPDELIEDYLNGTLQSDKNIIREITKNK